MATKIALSTSGLDLAPGSLVRQPGALVRAENCVIQAPGVLAKRQGLELAGATYGAGAGALSVRAYSQANGGLLHNVGDYNSDLAEELQSGKGESALTVIGTLSNDVHARMQAAVARRNCYLTADEGLSRLESDGTTLHRAGMPRAVQLDQTTVAVLNDAGAAVLYALAHNYACGYYVTWCKYDEDGLLMEGPPSAFSVVRNATGTTGYTAAANANISCMIRVPSELYNPAVALTTDYFYRLYRTAAVDCSTDAGASPPSDAQLVREAYLESADISAGYVTHIDTLAEPFRALGLALHANSVLGGDDGVGGPGRKQSNEPPPLCRTVEVFSDCLWGADVSYPHALEFTILATGSSGNVVTAGDILTIDSVTYTGVSGAPSSGQFRVFTSGTSASGVAWNIEMTAKSLVDAINMSATKLSLQAFYVSGPEDLPGKIRLVRNCHPGYSASVAFTASASAHQSAYLPALDSLASEAEAHSNGVAFSKPGQPDAWPTVNLLRLGRQDNSVLRLATLRDALYVFSESGLYRIVGSTFADFSAQEFDLTFRLVGRELVAVLDDAVWAWGKEGIARIDASGVRYVSGPIEPLLLPLTYSADARELLAKKAFAVGLPGAHRVLWWYNQESESELRCNKALCLDTRSAGWTTWSTYDLASGLTGATAREADDILYGCASGNSGNANWVYRERRTLADADYQDTTSTEEGFPVTMAVRWNAATPSPDTMSIFDEVHLWWHESEVTAAFDAPQSASLRLHADYASSGWLDVLPTAESELSRALVPTEARMSSRLEVELVSPSTVYGYAEYCAIEGVGVVYWPGGSTRTTRT